ncbi:MULTISPECIES: hypothetical protein [unclassified Mesorhizobium]|nr:MULTISPECIES: hypothetical protein [unclassified Mesorhizobium]MDG4904485.1 hypothetical protein [Mesorhizobium sp. WSM4962]
MVLRLQAEHDLASAEFNAIEKSLTATIGHSNIILCKTMASGD